jgi:hypothetical protein
MNETELESPRDEMGRLLSHGEHYWLDLPIHPNAAAALGEERMIVIFNQTMVALHNNVANRLIFAWSGSMRYPGCHGDVVFNEAGDAA